MHPTTFPQVVSGDVQGAQTIGIVNSIKMNAEYMLSTGEIGGVSNGIMLSTESSLGHAVFIKQEHCSPQFGNVQDDFALVSIVKDKPDIEQVSALVGNTSTSSKLLNVVSGNEVKTNYAVVSKVQNEQSCIKSQSNSDGDCTKKDLGISEDSSFEERVKHELGGPEFVCVGDGRIPENVSGSMQSDDPLEVCDRYWRWDPKMGYRLDNCKLKSSTENKHAEAQMMLLISRTSDNKEVYQCRICNKIFNWRKTLGTHMNYVCSHSESLKCNTCQKNFSLKGDLRCHLKFDCGRAEPHTCHRCGKTFAWWKSLNAHAKIDCTRQDTLKCQVCGDAFTLRCDLTDHVKYECGRKEPHKCEKCGQSFGHRKILVNHKMFHCGRPEPVQCTTCKKVFNSKEDLQLHDQVCGQKGPFTCPTCGKTYLWRKSLNTHVRQDCNLKEPHKCCACGKTFTIRRNLEQHMKHDCGRQEPHRCSICNKTFVWRQSLIAHMKQDCIVRTDRQGKIIEPPSHHSETFLV